MVAYPWASSSVFPMDESHVCCTCGCWATLPTLIIDGTTDPYFDEAEATDALTRVVACQVQYASDWDASPSASQAGDVLTIASGTSTTVFSFSGALRVYADADLDITISVSVSGSASSGEVVVYEDDQSTIVDTLSADGTIAILAAGYYWIKVTGGAAPPGTPTSLSATFTIDGGPNMQICTARAAWDDGGTTRYKPCT